MPPACMERSLFSCTAPPPCPESSHKPAPPPNPESPPYTPALSHLVLVPRQRLKQRTLGAFVLLAQSLEGGLRTRGGVPRDLPVLCTL